MDSEPAMPTREELERPFWNGYRSLLGSIADRECPTAEVMNRWLSPGLENASGAPIRFVSSEDIPGVDYERHIFETGQVSTRPGHFHDLFNALVWARYPRLKVAMNACHYRELPADGSRTRSRFRDALTLFDESGAIVCSPHADLLNNLARRDWKTAFVTLAEAWQVTQVLICGHALLEKFPRPYKSITAQVVFVQAPVDMNDPQMDQFLAQKLLENTLFTDTKGLSPLPLMGIPGWWPDGAQNPAFYADESVFRAPRRPFVPPAFHRAFSLNQPDSILPDPGHVPRGHAERQ